MLEYLNQHKVLLSAVPVLAYVTYIIYSFIRHLPTGLANLFFGIFGVPLTIIGQIVLFFLLKLAGEKSLIPAGILALVAAFAVLSTIYKMIFFKKVKVLTNTKVNPSVIRKSK